MDRRELIKVGGGAFAGLVFGETLQGAVAEASLGEDFLKGRPFGRFSEELIAARRSKETYVVTETESGHLQYVKPVPEEDLKDQFFVFQLTPTTNGKWYIRSPQEVEPVLETNDQYPDVALDCRLVSFNFAGSEKIDSDTKATARITFGTDHSTERGRRLGENLYWAITSGINLWKSRGLRAQPRDLRSDFREAFGNKYVELPGGAGTLRVEIVKHKKSSWWEKVFNFSTSPAGGSLVTALGFPGVTASVLHFVDEAANRMVDKHAKVLFSSRGLPIAFTKQAKREISAMGTRIGSLKTGIWIFARGRDLPLLAAQEMTYDATLRRLFPAKSNIADILSGRQRDPLEKVTYAVLQTRLKRRKITVGF